MYVCMYVCMGYVCTCVSWLCFWSWGGRQHTGYGRVMVGLWLTENAHISPTQNTPPNPNSRCIHTYTHSLTYSHAHIHTHTYTHTQIHTHVHTHAPMHPPGWCIDCSMAEYWRFKHCTCSPIGLTRIWVGTPASICVCVCVCVCERVCVFVHRPINTARVWQV